MRSRQSIHWIGKPGDRSKTLADLDITKDQALGPCFWMKRKI